MILIEGNLRSVSYIILILKYIYLKSIGEKVCQKGLIYGDIFMKEQN